MAPEWIIRYDEAFMRRFEKLGEMLETADRPALHRFLIDNFGNIFTTFQYYANRIACGDARDFEEEDEETRRELLRPLSYRQYRVIEQSFSVWANEEQYVLSSVWDFLYDEGRIRNKKVMSVAEVDGCALVLEQVYVCLAGRHGGKKGE